MRAGLVNISVIFHTITDNIHKNTLGAAENKGYQNYSHWINYLKGAVLYFESKQTLSEWLNICKKHNLEVNYNLSKPIGIISGLSYLTWIDDNFVPERKEIEGQENYSELFQIHKQIKSIFAKFDPISDDFINQDSVIYQSLIDTLRGGNINNIFIFIKDIYLELIKEDKIYLNDQEKITFDLFFEKILKINFNDNKNAWNVQNTFSQQNPTALLGNSTLIVLEHKK